MLVKRKITLVEPGRTFWFAGHQYRMAMPDERKSMPGSADVVKAYHTSCRSGRFPVTLNPLAEVYVEQEKS